MAKRWLVQFVFYAMGQIFMIIESVCVLRKSGILARVIDISSPSQIPSVIYRLKLVITPFYLLKSFLVTKVHYQMFFKISLPSNKHTGKRFFPVIN